MDTELSAWVEEETTSYGYAPYTDSEASFFNGEINSQQPNIMAQVSIAKFGIYKMPLPTEHHISQQKYLIISLALK